MNYLPTLAFVLLLAAAALQAAFAFKKERREEPVSRWLILISALLLGATTVSRSVAIGFPALTGTYESLVFYAAAVSILLFVYRSQSRLPRLPLIATGGTVVAAVLLALANSPLAPKAALAPIPALRSGWLILHVAFTFIGEAFFVAAFVASLAFLLGKNEAKKADYDRITYTATALGYPFFTAGALVFGAIWAEKAWGAWWSWDPKETWGLVTWLVYTAYLHLRFTRKRQDKLPALVCVLGFLSALFTFFGVNYLLPGLHSYR